MHWMYASQDTSKLAGFRAKSTIVGNHRNNVLGKIPKSFLAIEFINGTKLQARMSPHIQKYLFKKKYYLENKTKTITELIFDKRYKSHYTT